MSKATENMVNMFDWLNRDGVTDIQIVENGTGAQYFFWPVPKVEEGEIFCGFFFTNEQEAMRFREFIETSNIFFTDQSILHSFDYIYLNLILKDDTIKITTEGMGKFKDNPELVPEVTSFILNFFDTDNLSFEDMSLMYKTDLNLSDSELEDFLLNIVGYYQDSDKAAKQAYNLLESPRTGKRFYAAPTRINQSRRNSLASFMIAKQEDLEERLEAARYRGSKRVDIPGCLMFMIVSRQGKLKFVDVALQEYETMSRDERRALVMDFLNTIKDTAGVDTNKVKERLVEQGFIIDKVSQ